MSVKNYDSDETRLHEGFKYNKFVIARAALRLTKE